MIRKLESKMDEAAEEEMVVVEEAVTRVEVGEEVVIEAEAVAVVAAVEATVEAALVVAVAIAVVVAEVEVAEAVAEAVVEAVAAEEEEDEVSQGLSLLKLNFLLTYSLIKIKLKHFKLTI